MSTKTLKSKSKPSTREARQLAKARPIAARTPRKRQVQAVPDDWSSDLEDRQNNPPEARATAAVAKAVDAATHIQDRHPGREQIHTLASLYSNGGGEGENLLRVNDYCTPGEAIDLCRCIAAAIERFRLEQSRSDAAQLGLCGPAGELLPIPDSPRVVSTRKPEKTAGGEKVFVVAIGDGEQQSDGAIIGQYGTHAERLMVIHPDDLERFEQELGNWLQSVPFASDVTDALRSLADDAG